MRIFIHNRVAMHLVVLSLLAVVSLSLIVTLLLAETDVLTTVGRDATLTGRTELWGEVVAMTENPLFGCGFENFWMGPRLDKIWAKHWWHPNEAHNGYLEVYLNLGWVGLALLSIVIVTGYRNAFRMLYREPDIGGLILSYFVVGLTYSFTEAGFRLLNPVWITFMLAAIAVPRLSHPKTAGTRNRLTPMAWPKPIVFDEAEESPTLLSASPRRAHSPSPRNVRSHNWYE
jgi:O-antigen ligase